MKQRNFKIKRLCSRTLKNFINEMYKPVHKREISYKRAICIIVLEH